MSELIENKNTKNMETEKVGVNQISSPENKSIANEHKRRFNKEGYKNIADNFYNLLKPGEQRGKENYVLEDNAKEKLSNFVSKLLANKHIALVVEGRTGDRTDEDILKTLFSNQERGVIDSDRNFDFLINNIEARKKEVSKNAEEVIKRVEENPIASEDELMIGIYKENLESQVRDAVIVLKHKGYSSFESGFDDPVNGSQYIGFNKESTKGRIDIPPKLVEELKQEGITLLIDTSKSDRDTITLIPTMPENSKPMSVKDWKKVWDKVADDLPEIGQASTNKMGNLANEFAERQQKIKRGENVYLGYGVAFWNGKPQRMVEEEFLQRTSNNSLRAVKAEDISNIYGKTEEGEPFDALAKAHEEKAKKAEQADKTRETKKEEDKKRIEEIKKEISILSSEELVEKKELSPQIKEFLDVHTKRLNKVMNFDFRTEAGYSEEELEKLDALEYRYMEILRESGGDVSFLLKHLVSEGTGIIEDSKFLTRNARSLKDVISRAAGKVSGINAAYISSGQISDLLGKSDLSGVVRLELESVKENGNGAIFLQESSTVKSRFHESIHALQNSMGFDMDAKNETERTKREMEASYLMVKLREMNVLNGVDLFNYKEVKGPFGPMLRFGTNDVEREISLFEDYTEKLKELNSGK